MSASKEFWAHPLLGKIYISNEETHGQLQREHQEELEAERGRGERARDEAVERERGYREQVAAAELDLRLRSLAQVCESERVCVGERG